MNKKLAWALFRLAGEVRQEIVAVDMVLDGREQGDTPA
jgi:hypothetical protein